MPIVRESRQARRAHRAEERHECSPPTRTYGAMVLADMDSGTIWECGCRKQWVARRQCWHRKWLRVPKGDKMDRNRPLGVFELWMAFSLLMVCVLYVVLG